VKVGDLVKVPACQDGDGYLIGPCECFFCIGKSNRIGVVLCPAPRNSWTVMFDCGDWRLDDFEVIWGEVEIINETH